MSEAAAFLNAVGLASLYLDAFVVNGFDTTSALVCSAIAPSCLLCVRRPLLLCAAVPLHTIHFCVLLCCVASMCRSCIRFCALSPIVRTHSLSVSCVASSHRCSRSPTVPARDCRRDQCMHTNASLILRHFLLRLRSLLAPSAAAALGRLSVCSTPTTSRCSE